MKNVHEVTIDIANASGLDATFLKGIVALFTDPANAEALQSIRTAELAIVYNPKNGQCHLLPTADDDAPAKSYAPEMLNFVARFDSFEWATLAGATNVKELLREDVAIAEVRAREVLGYLPPGKAMEIAHE